MEQLVTWIAHIWGEWSNVDTITKLWFVRTNNPHHRSTKFFSDCVASQPDCSDGNLIKLIPGSCYTWLFQYGNWGRANLGWPDSFDVRKLYLANTANINALNGKAKHIAFFQEVRGLPSKMDTQLLMNELDPNGSNNSLLVKSTTTSISPLGKFLSNASQYTGNADGSTGGPSGLKFL